MENSNRPDPERDSVTSADTQRRLTLWYLARLRQEAEVLQAAARLTPLARIESDRLLIEKLAAAAHRDVLAPPVPGVSRNVPLTVVLCNALAFTALLAGNGWDWPGAIDAYLGCTVKLLFFVKSDGLIDLSPSLACLTAFVFFLLPPLLLAVAPSRWIFSSEPKECVSK